jgi:hypothetical protein
MLRHAGNQSEHSDLRPITRVLGCLAEPLLERERRVTRATLAAAAVGCFDAPRATWPLRPSARSPGLPAHQQHSGRRHGTGPRCRRSRLLPACGPAHHQRRRPPALPRRGPASRPAHHYYIVVTALDVPTTGVPDTANPALALFQTLKYVVGAGPTGAPLLHLSDPILHRSRLGSSP